jgi:hypothetical protein
MNSRHLTGHAVDLVALDGEISWQWEDYFRVPATMQAAAREFGVPVRWGGCWGSLFTIETPRGRLRRLRRGLPGTWPQAVPRRPALRAALGRVPGMIDWIKTVEGIAAIVAGSGGENPARCPACACVGRSALGHRPALGPDEPLEA